MQIVFANRYYAPDNSATSQLFTDLAEHLAAQGHQVIALTSRQHYNNPAARLPARETINGVNIRRIWTSNFGRKNLAGRALDYLSFYLAFLLAGLTTLKRDSVLVCGTDPPLLSIPAAASCRLKGARLVNWLQDLYPEVAVALGVVAERSPLTRILGRLRDLSLRAASHNVVLGQVMAARVGACGVDPQRIVAIHNWSVAPLPGATADNEPNPLRRDWGIEQRFVVGYSGNLGKAHEIDTLLQAAAILRDEKDICLLMIGEGHYTPELRERATRQQLDNFLFKPYQPLQQLHHSLAAIDVHLVILRPEMEGCIVPSKFYGAAASARPVIFVGSAQGEIAHILAESGAGLQVASGDGDGLAEAIIALRDDFTRREEMGARARHLAETLYSRSNSLAQWLVLLDTLEDRAGVQTRGSASSR